ncbi:hypothetical protein [Candidatus Electrothrix sp.]|uniref:hypothetical protein n=1 Tax=Candidatus Electrothrix sp. TaxID=2170559 RepID=UPI0040575B4A
MVGTTQDNTLSALHKKERADPPADPLRATGSERAQLLVELWQAGQVREMREVNLGPDFLHPVVLELHAKAAYLVLNQEGRQTEPAAVHHFIDCWLSFLFHPSLFHSLANKPETPGDREQYRLELLEIGETMVRKYADQQLEQGALFIRHWEEDYAVLKVVAKANNEKKKEPEELPFYTPALAWQAGIAEKIFHLVQRGRGIVTEQEDEEYLAAGAWYSSVGPALLLARELAHQGEAADNAFASLKQDVFHKKSKYKKAEPFFLYGLARLKIACGIYALDQGRYKEAEKVLTGLLPLPPHSARLEQELLAALDQEDRYLNPDELTVCVHVLTDLHEHSPTKAVKKALCSLLTHQAVLLHNTRNIDGTALQHMMEQAVSLNPDDTFARMTLDDARMDAEIFSLHQTMSAGKLSKASRIAKKSSYQGVVDQFFVFAAQVIEQVEAGDYPDIESAFFMVSQLLEGALQVDPEHRMIKKITLLADELEERLEAP